MPRERSFLSKSCVRPLPYLCALFVLGLSPARADFLDDAEQALTLSAFDQKLRLKLSGTLDLENYYGDKPLPGLIYSAQRDLFNPRLTVYLDAQIGENLYGFVQARFDRGFDPSDGGAEIRLDEYALRLTPSKRINLGFEIGKFGTIVGNWVPRHYSWDNPFINAPLPYENVTGIWDTAAPDSVGTLLYWGHVP